MRVLVIEDAIWNQESAHETLEGHDVTIAGTVEEAYKILSDARSKPFDAVLTDLLMPRPVKVPEYILVGATDQYSVGEIPAGLIFAIVAKNQGSPYVAILTDSDHHQDMICALLDLAAKERGNKIGKFEVRYFCRRVETEDSNYPTDLLFDTNQKKLVQRRELSADEQYGNHLRLVKDWGALLEYLTTGTTRWLGL